MAWGRWTSPRNRQPIRDAGHLLTSEILAARRTLSCGLFCLFPEGTVAHVSKLPETCGIKHAGNRSQARTPVDHLGGSGV